MTTPSSKPPRRSALAGSAITKPSASPAAEAEPAPSTQTPAQPSASASTAPARPSADAGHGTERLYIYPTPSDAARFRTAAKFASMHGDVSSLSDWAVSLLEDATRSLEQEFNHGQPFPGTPPRRTAGKRRGQD